MSVKIRCKVTIFFLFSKSLWCFLFSRLFFLHITEGTPGNGSRQGKGANVGTCLAHLDTKKSETMGQDDDERDEEKTASGSGYQVGAYGLSNGLREHIGQYDEGHEWKAEYLPAQGCCSHTHHFVLVSEESDDGFGRDKSCNSADGKEDRAALDTEGEGFFYTTVETCAITESAKWLESLSQTDDDGIGEEGYSGDNTHAGDGCVSV